MPRREYVIQYETPEGRLHALDVLAGPDAINKISAIKPDSEDRVRFQTFDRSDEELWLILTNIGVGGLNTVHVGRVDLEENDSVV